MTNNEIQEQAPDCRMYRVPIVNFGLLDEKMLRQIEDAFSNGYTPEQFQERILSSLMGHPREQLQEYFDNLQQVDRYLAKRRAVVEKEQIEQLTAAELKNLEQRMQEINTEEDTVRRDYETRTKQTETELNQAAQEAQSAYGILHESITSKAIIEAQNVLLEQKGPYRIMSEDLLSLKMYYTKLPEDAYTELKQLASKVPQAKYPKEHEVGELERQTKMELECVFLDYHMKLGDAKTDFMILKQIGELKPFLDKWVPLSWDLDSFSMKRRKFQLKLIKILFPDYGN